MMGYFGTNIFDHNIIKYYVGGINIKMIDTLVMYEVHGIKYPMVKITS